MEKKQFTALVKMAIAGNDKAFAELYQLKFKNILYHAYNILGNKPDAEDATQEIIVKMYLGISRLKKPEKFNAWLQRVIENECLSVIRRREVRKGEMPTGDEIINNIMEKDIEFLPQDFVENTEINKQIIRIVNSLPKKRKRAIQMFYFEDMSFSEIANVMDVTVSTVSTNLMKGRSAIKEQLEQYLQTPIDRKKVDKTVSVAPASVLGQILMQDSEMLFAKGRVLELIDSTKNIITSKAIFSGAAGGSGAGLSLAAKIISTVLVSTIIVTSSVILYTKENNNEMQNGSDPVVVSQGQMDEGKNPEERREESQEPIDQNQQTAKDQNINQDNKTSNVDLPGTEPHDRGWITFMDGDCDCNHVNPQKAIINDVDISDSFHEWVISDDRNDKIIYRGSNNTITSEFSQLKKNRKDGDYTISYKFTDIKGNSVEMKKKFTIDSNEIQKNQYS